MEIDQTTLILIYLISAIAFWVILYHVIKSAVKNGIIESRQKAESFQNKGIPEKLPNSAQEKLQNRYDKGEITFEEYQKEWVKLDA